MLAMDENVLPSADAFTNKPNAMLHAPPEAVRRVHVQDLTAWRLRGLHGPHGLHGQLGLMSVWLRTCWDELGFFVDCLNPTQPP